MASLVDHVSQANHNKELAHRLDSSGGLKYRDWLITIAFYAAIHYVEAFFTTVKDVGHTEVACSQGEGRHPFRERMVKRHLGRECWSSYRKLSNASTLARYLLPGPGQVGPAERYFTRQQARRLFRHDLKVVRDEVDQHVGVQP